jgi:hypothetical protein
MACEEEWRKGVKSTEIRVERFNVVSAKSFEETLAGLYAGIGRPAMSTLAPKLAAAESFSEFEQLVNGAVGTADLMEFLRLDLGMALRKDPAETAYKMIRIIAGNPLIMKRRRSMFPTLALTLRSPFSSTRVRTGYISLTTQWQAFCLLMETRRRWR